MIFMILNDIHTIWLREMKRFLRDKTRIVSSLAMPFFWLVFIGIGIGSSFQLPGLNYISFIAPGIIGMNILFTSIFIGVSVIWERQFGFLKEVLVAPVSRMSIVLGKTFGGTTVSVMDAVIMMIITIVIGAVTISMGILPAIAFMILTAMCFVSVGLIIAARMKSMEGFQMIMSFFIMPIFFLSGALFPIQNTPTWLQAISHIDPLTYAVDGIRGSLIGVNMYPLYVDIAILAGFTLAFILIASYMFSKRK